MYELIVDEDIRLVSCGNTRSFFVFAGHEREQVVLKIADIERDVSPEKYVVNQGFTGSGKLTSSPYVSFFWRQRASHRKHRPTTVLGREAEEITTSFQPKTH